MIESLPFRHELFLRDMQAWVWMRYPTRQLSATDVFYALQWAASGLCARDFTSAFDAYLAEHPDVFDRGCRLSRLQYEAKRVIGAEKRRQSTLPAAQMPWHGDIVEDPYDVAICRIIECGKRTEQPPIRDILRKAYVALIQAHQVSIAAHPNWRETPESFAKYKAQCLADYASAVDLTFEGVNELLCDEEKAKLRRLDQREKIRAFQLGNDAKARFLAQIYRRNVAGYFGLDVLLSPL